MLLVQAIQMVCMSGVRGAKFSVDDVKFSCGDVKEDVVEPSPSMFVGLILTDFFFLFSQPVHSPDRCQRCCWSCVWRNWRTWQATASTGGPPPTPSSRSPPTLTLMTPPCQGMSRLLVRDLLLFVYGHQQNLWWETTPCLWPVFLKRFPSHFVYMNPSSGTTPLSRPPLFDDLKGDLNSFYPSYEYTGSRSPSVSDQLQIWSSSFFFWWCSRSVRVHYELWQ